MADTPRLVVIDDDTGVLKALSMLLQAIGYGVTPFSSATAALDHITSSQAVDIVVSDLRMAPVSGEDVLQGVRRYSTELPVIIMSGHATPEEVKRLSDLGMNGFLPKPFTPEMFNRTISEVHKTARTGLKGPVTPCLRPASARG